MYWDGNGFWLLYKRLEKEHFQFPIRDDGIATWYYVKKKDS